TSARAATHASTSGTRRRIATSRSDLIRSIASLTSPSSPMCERLRVGVAVVTGSKGGIGSATAAAFEAAGLHVPGVDLEDDFPTVERIDALVCTHGISGRSLGDGPVDACTEEGWDAVLDANLKSVFLYAKLALPALRANGGGAIVALSSALG